mmetsp:Transcript_14209/g.24285  ORF Transcript_14209/g.24285 Transcript_14209/m.24285 type:complete len:88 (-) Transcript_14209:219-482(-)
MDRQVSANRRVGDTVASPMRRRRMPRWSERKDGSDGGWDAVGAQHAMFERDSKGSIGCVNEAIDGNSHRLQSNYILLPIPIFTHYAT